MKITLNDQSMELKTIITIDTLLHQLERHQQGHAIAINKNIIPRNEWKTHLLQENDEILLFQAIAGG
ncbi:sulfur carrier protein ThiS [Candidatus Fukatsuia anoeciicola]|uniref:sulfur carrier protein ThiS n=1 Tax=Candidatus Fukatsuia anoeciicola TaxID=2994492 RepID=UPI00346471B1